jgi:cell shape-determining protein MreC
MPFVDRAEYRSKKIIADNLNAMIDKKFIEISTDEYNRVNAAIDSYSNAINQKISELHNIAITEEQKTELIAKLEQLERDIDALKEVAYDSVNIESGTLDITNIK